MTKKKIIPAIQEKGLSAFDQVWVVLRFHGDIEVNRVYIDKKEAEEEAERVTTLYKDYYRKLYERMKDSQMLLYHQDFEEYYKKLASEKAIVVSLNDAIEKIKDYIRDEFYSNNEEY